MSVARFAGVLRVSCSSSPAANPSLTTRLVYAEVGDSGTYTMDAPTQQLTISNVLSVAGRATVTITGLTVEACSAQECGWTTPVEDAEIATVHGTLAAAVASSFATFQDIQQSLATFDPPLSAWKTMVPSIGARLQAGPYYVLATTFALSGAATQSWSLEDLRVSYRAQGAPTRSLDLTSQRIAIQSPPPSPAGA